jgi:regulatory protein
MSQVDRQKELRLTAIRFLTMRSLTGAELSAKLIGKGATEAEAAALVEEFRTKRLLDESGILEDEVKRASSSKLIGRREVKQRLLRRGVPVEDIDREISASYTPEQEFETALAFARRKMRLIEYLPVSVQYRRIGAALERKGFASSSISRVLRALKLGDSEDS